VSFNATCKSLYPFFPGIIIYDAERERLTTTPFPTMNGMLNFYSITGKLHEAFLFQVPNLIAIFLITFASLKELPCKSLDGI
jgi:hypothetical protein